MAQRKTMNANDIESLFKTYRPNNEFVSHTSNYREPEICSHVFLESTREEVVRFLEAHKKNLVAHAARLNDHGNYHDLRVYQNDTIHDALMKIFFFYGKEHADITAFYTAIRGCDSASKVKLATLFCSYVLRRETTGYPSVALSAVCVDLINVINSLQNLEILISVYANLELLLAGKTLVHYQALARFLRRGDDLFNNLLTIHKATKTQIAFCDEKRMNVEFLALLVEREIDRAPQPAAAAAAAGGQLVALSLADLARAKLAPCDRLAALGMVFDLFPNNPDTVMTFLRDHEASLFGMNTEMYTDVFVRHARKPEVVDKAQFARALSRQELREDNDFVLAIFAALDLPHSLRALEVLEQKGHKKLTAPQKQCITVAFRDATANPEDKYNFFVAMFDVNFTPQALIAIGTLYSILINRSDFIAALKSLKPGNKLFADLFIALLQMLRSKGEQIDYAYARELSETANFSKREIEAIGRLHDVVIDKADFVEGLKSLKTGNKLLTDTFVELLEILHQKNVSITFAYAKHLATVQCLLQFKDVMRSFPEAGIQAIFDSESVRAKPADWVRAFMIQAQISGDAELQRKEIQLVFHLWTYAEAHANEIGMSRQDLLGSGFDERFVEFLEGVNIDTVPELRYALLADVSAAVGLLMPARATPAALPAPRGMLSIFGSRTPAALPAPEPEATIPNLAQRVFARLGVISIEGIGANARPVFSSPDDIAGFARFRRLADMQRLALPDAPRSYLALLDAPIAGGPVIEEAPAEEAGAEGAIVPYQRPDDRW
jgi:hypothetical protein